MTLAYQAHQPNIADPSFQEDPISIIGTISGAFQIAGQCAQCALLLAKYIDQVKKVDERINRFFEEVSSLRNTYQNLHDSLNSPRMQEAAQTADQTVGGHLWAQIHVTVRDCSNTMTAIYDILFKINKSTWKPYKQLQEQLANGELSRLRERVGLFNTTLALPLQMITVTLQLEQKDISADSQKQLESQISTLQATIGHLTYMLGQPHTRTSIGGSTIVSQSSEDKAVYAHLNQYVKVAQRFLTTASVRASSDGSVPSTFGKANPFENRRGSVGIQPLTKADKSRIDSWVPAPKEIGPDTPSSAEAMSPALSPPPNPFKVDEDSESGSDVELTLVRQYLKNGQNKTDNNDHAGAEENYREALALMYDNEFGDDVACQPADLVLMIATSCLKQKKYEEVVKLLSPLTDGARDGSSTSPRGPDDLQKLAASHILGETYRSMDDYDQAESYALAAFKGRKTHLGKQHEKTLESVRLVISVYTARGKDVKAEAYKAFLEVPAPRPSISAPVTTTNALRDSTDAIARTVSTQLQPDPVVDPSPKSKFTLPFRISGRNRQESSSSPSLPPFNFSRTTTLNDSTLTVPNGASPPRSIPPYMQAFGSISTTSEQSKALSDDGHSVTSSLNNSRSVTFDLLEPRFLHIQQLSSQGKHKQAVDHAMKILKKYNSEVMIHREPELAENIRKGGSHGLAGTGHGYAPIHFFCGLKEECPTEVNLLIQQGVDVNATFAYKAGYPGSARMTAIQVAVERGHFNLVKMLLEVEGVDPNVKDKDGFTPLLVACRRKHLSIVELLLDHGVLVKPVDGFPNLWCGNSLMHDAAWRCDVALVQLLVNKGFEVSGKDEFEATPLIYAVRGDEPDQRKRDIKIAGRLPTVGILLQAGASVMVKDRKGMTAVDHARGEGCDALLQLLGRALR